LDFITGIFNIKEGFTEINVESMLLVEKAKKKYFPALSLAAAGTLLYVAGGILWIYLSDYLLKFLTTSLPEFSRYQMYKGFFFIVITGFILFVVIARYSKTIHDAEEAFRKTIEGVKDYAIFLLDEKGNVITWNKGAELLSGYSTEDIMGKSSTVFFPDGETDKMSSHEQLETARKNGKAVFEGDRVRRDGSVYYVLTTITTLYNKKGSVSGFLKISYDLTERKKAEEVIIRNRQQIRDLMEHLEIAKEEERVNIAREIHDELGQMLTSLKIDLSLLSKDAGTGMGKIEDRIESMKQKINSSINTVRKISSGLRPDGLDYFGIEATIESELQSLNNSTGIKTRLNSTIDNLKITNRQTSIAVYRIYKEAITNILRHSNAASVTVNISLNEKKDFVLEICDDGAGFNSDVIIQTSFGLMGMKERAAILGGSLAIESFPGAGCKIRLIVPSDRLAA
jgi:PAS domain S-box-containing protein